MSVFALPEGGDDVGANPGVLPGRPACKLYSAVKSTTTTTTKSTKTKTAISTATCPHSHQYTVPQFSFCLFPLFVINSAHGCGSH